MNGFEKRREEKKKQIKIATYKLLSKKEINEVTIKMIATEAKVSQVSIYNFFESKENLIKLLVMDILDRKITITREIIKSDLNFKDKINKIIEIKIHSLKEFSGNFLTEFILNDNELLSINNNINSKVEELFSDLFDYGKSENCISKEIDNSTLLLYFTVFRNGLSSLPVKQLDNNIIESLIKLFFQSITSRG